MSTDAAWLVEGFANGFDGCSAFGTGLARQPALLHQIGAALAQTDMHAVEQHVIGRGVEAHDALAIRRHRTLIHAMALELFHRPAHVLQQLFVRGFGNMQLGLDAHQQPFLIGRYLLVSQTHLQHILIPFEIFLFGCQILGIHNLLSFFLVLFREDERRPWVDPLRGFGVVIDEVGALLALVEAHGPARGQRPRVLPLRRLGDVVDEVDAAILILLGIPS